MIENKIDLIDDYNYTNKDAIEDCLKKARIRLYRPEHTSKLVTYQTGPPKVVKS
ncbi:unnamed protein product [Nippostrongylus brasiliensis]|uniref:DDE_3 domain-containing protein n=1 Tax=Nippostrongylus brasiliensis TaxID=27835 RepID=A0A0N4XMN7_NIPBR|nr:unnamed protein product [Nippostrongylus brasiliensis]